MKKKKATPEQEMMMHQLHFFRALFAQQRQLCAETGDRLKELNTLFCDYLDVGEVIEGNILKIEKTPSNHLRLRERVKIYT